MPSLLDSFYPPCRRATLTAVVPRYYSAMTNERSILRNSHESPRFPPHRVCLSLPVPIDGECYATTERNKVSEIPMKNAWWLINCILMQKKCYRVIYVYIRGIRLEELNDVIDTRGKSHICRVIVTCSKERLDKDISLARVAQFQFIPSD